jgi:hypothetical protein
MLIILFLQMLNGHVLLRIGGGWDTLEHYLLTHMPKVGKFRAVKPVPDEQVFYDKFSHDKFYLFCLYRKLCQFLLSMKS